MQSQAFTKIVIDDDMDAFMAVVRSFRASASEKNIGDEKIDEWLSKMTALLNSIYTNLYHQTKEQEEPLYLRNHTALLYIDQLLEGTISEFHVYGENKAGAALFTETWLAYWQSVRKLFKFFCKNLAEDLSRDIPSLSKLFTEELDEPASDAKANPYYTETTSSYPQSLSRNTHLLVLKKLGTAIHTASQHIASYYLQTEEYSKVEAFCHEALYWADKSTEIVKTDNNALFYAKQIIYSLLALSYAARNNPDIADFYLKKAKENQAKISHHRKTSIPILIETSKYEIKKFLKEENYRDTYQALVRCHHTVDDTKKLAEESLKMGGFVFKTLPAKCQTELAWLKEQNDAFFNLIKEKLIALRKKLMLSHYFKNEISLKDKVLIIHFEDTKQLNKYCRIKSFLAEQPSLNQLTVKINFLNNDFASIESELKIIIELKTGKQAPIPVKTTHAEINQALQNKPVTQQQFETEEPDDDIKKLKELRIAAKKALKEEKQLESTSVHKNKDIKQPEKELANDYILKSPYLPRGKFINFFDREALLQELNATQLTRVDEKLKRGKVIYGPGDGIKYIKNDYNKKKLAGYTYKVKFCDGDLKHTRVYGHLGGTTEDGKIIVNFDHVEKDTHQKLKRVHKK